jgi:Reverse transcriptase (RNA-dependent DNA polymerase)
MSSMPSGRKVVGNRLVYSEKSDGTLRSRTVAQGFSQVPGKDFTDSHAPVMTDLAFRLALVIKVLMKLRTGQFELFYIQTLKKKSKCAFQKDTPNT